ncbi:mechanosensitive ion channel family protein [Halococcus hamelinensis]|uniref:Mechanosensitive ion channel MscS n=1 Tax=Halococcus hamelinensis 100A6 TaxID=1132509 RepID=M0LZ69_9EURY|nr:mechanosensitive ion channel family protein [Halococcus hamelinensis]EMA38862.1 mechanosensitive ion channel MscS [Halococcus hamelinensis 100A6]
MILATGFVRWLQTTYLSSTGSRVLGTFGALLLLGVVVYLVDRAGRPFKNRYSSRLTEAFQAGIVAVWLILTVVWVTVVWNITWALDIVINTLSINRLTAVRALFTVTAIIVAYLFVRLLNRSIDRLSEEHGAITDHQSEMAYHVADVGVFVVVGFVSLAIWGISLGNLFLSAGVLGAIVGLAGRETIGAITAGFVLLFSRPFHVGDWIQTADHEGVVRDVTIVNTKLRTFDDEHVLIPNDEITSNPLVNRSENDRLRLDLEVGVDYETDLDRAMEVAQEAMTDVEAVREMPAPRVISKRFAESGIVLELRWWIGNPSAQREWKAKTAVITGVKTAFDREGISIPYPQRTLSAREEATFEVDEMASEGVPRSDAATDGGE